MRRRKIRRQTMGKEAVKHSGTFVANVGNGSAAGVLTAIVTNVGLRLNTGATSTIQAQANTSNTCMVGDIIKYIDFCIEVCARGITVYPDAQDNGWLEYAIVKQKEGDVTIATTNLGTKTLGDICTQVFRGDCLWTGCIPVGAQQPNSLDIKIKLPKVFTKMQQGSKLQLLTFMRSSNSADVRTTSHRLVLSYRYKCYN